MKLRSLKTLPLVLSLGVHALVILSTFHTQSLFSTDLAANSRAASKSTTISLITTYTTRAVQRPNSLPKVLKAPVVAKAPQLITAEESKKTAVAPKMEVPKTVSTEEAPVKEVLTPSQSTEKSITYAVSDALTGKETASSNDTFGSTGELGSSQQSESAITRKTAFNLKVIRNRSPKYPEFARMKRFQGTVVYRVKVLVNGNVGSAELISSSGYQVLDQSAKEAIRYWRFQPATQFGMPIETWVEIPFTFELKS